MEKTRRAKLTFIIASYCNTVAFSTTDATLPMKIRTLRELVGCLHAAGIDPGSLGAEIVSLVDAWDRVYRAWREGVNLPSKPRALASMKLLNGIPGVPYSLMPDILARIQGRLTRLFWTLFTTLIPEEAKRMMPKIRGLEEEEEKPEEETRLAVFG